MAVTKMSNVHWAQNIGTYSTTPMSMGPPLFSCQFQAGPSVTSLLPPPPVLMYTYAPPWH